MKNLVKEIFNKHFNDEAIGISEIIGKGMVSRVFKIETQDSKFIIKTLENESSTKEYNKEKWCLDQMKNIDIPSPEVYFVGTYENNAYIVMEFIDGECGTETKLDRDLIWKTLGEYASKINNIKVDGFGLDFNNGKFVNGHTQTWEDYVDYNLSMLTDDDVFIEKRIYSLEQRDKIKNIFNELKNNISLALSHSDLSPRNVIIRNGRVYLYDFGAAFVTIKFYYDMITLLKSQIMINIPEILESDIHGVASDKQFEEFLNGYGVSLGEYKNKHEVKTHAVLLLDAFDKLRWAVDKSPISVKGLTIYAKKVVEIMLRYRDGT